MQQTKLVSLIEALLNSVIGFAVSLLAWPVVGAIVGVSYSTGQHVGIVFIFTLIGVAKGYVIRRFFNANLHSLTVALVAKLFTNKRLRRDP